MPAISYTGYVLDGPSQSGANPSLFPGMMFNVGMDKCKGVNTSYFIKQLYESLGVFMVGDGWRTKQSNPPPVGVSVTVGGRIRDNFDRFRLQLCCPECKDRTSCTGCTGAVSVGWIEVATNGYVACVGGMLIGNRSISRVNTTAPWNPSFKHTSEVSRIAGLMQRHISGSRTTDDDIQSITCYINRAVRDSLMGIDDGNFIVTGTCPCTRLYVGDPANTKDAMRCFERGRHTVLTGSNQWVASQFGLVCTSDEADIDSAWAPSPSQIGSSQCAYSNIRHSELCIPDMESTQCGAARKSIECAEWMY